MFAVFIFGSPIWLAGHAGFYAGGARINRGDKTKGLIWIWAAGILSLGILGYGWVVLLAFGLMSYRETSWSLPVIIYGFPVYAAVVLIVLVSTFFLRPPKR